MSDGNPLGTYLKDRRAKIDPAAFGFSARRRRTPGLRREEVASRANISPTWYTWLEQGRGGAPSPDVLERISGALMLTEIEREHLFLLALKHPPEARFTIGHSVSPRLQHILDALEPVPALMRTATWDVVAWNRAVGVMLVDYAALPVGERNILRALFLDPEARGVQYDWQSVARFVVGAFRVDVARAGASAEVTDLISELCSKSAEFAAMWRENDVQAPHGDRVKHIRHPVLGRLAFEYTAFAVDGRPDLSMIVYNPVEAADRARIAELMG